MTRKRGVSAYSLPVKRALSFSMCVDQIHSASESCSQEPRSPCFFVHRRRHFFGGRADTSIPLLVPIHLPLGRVLVRGFLLLSLHCGIGQAEDIGTPYTLFVPVCKPWSLSISAGKPRRPQSFEPFSLSVLSKAEKD